MIKNLAIDGLIFNRCFLPLGKGVLGYVTDLEFHPIALHDGEHGVTCIHTGCRRCLVEGLARIRVCQMTARC